jgi:iron complex outermembrane receptor protein
MGVGSKRWILMALLAAAASAWAQEPATGEPAPAEEPAAEETAPAADASPTEGGRHETRTRRDQWWQEGGAAAAPGEAPPADAATADPPASAPAAVGEAAPLPTVPVATGEDTSVPADTGSTKLDDIMVTSQKRVQSIQDVPISVSAMTAEFIHEQGLTDIRDAMALMPNVKMEEAGFFTAPRIRGFTFNNNNKAFEPPVGIVIDGMPYTRPEYFMMTLFDIDRVEVMRGPQGTTFGKNTTAGLVHLMTKDPTATPEGRLQLQGGELNRRHIEAAYGNTLMDGVNFRVSGLYDHRDGYIRNTYHEVDPTVPDAYKNRERTGGRMKLGFDDIFGSTLKLGLEHVTLVSGGAAFEYVEVTPDFDAAARRYDPGFDSIPGNWTAAEDFPGFRDVKITTYNGEWNNDVGGWNVVAVGGHSRMWQTLQLDVDFTPAPSTIGFGSDSSPTTTFELRTTSPTFEGLFGLTNLFGWNPGSTDWLVGGFYEKRGILDSVFRFGIDQQATAELVQGANGNTTTGGGDFGGIGNVTPQDYEEVIQLFNQRAQALGAFTHLKWQFLPRWAAEAGVRYTTEEKDADWNLFFTTNGGTAAGNPLATALGFIPFTDALTREEDNIQPKFSLEYEPIDDIKLFAHWTRGYKGGGFNAFAYRNLATDPNTNSTKQPPERTTEDLEYEPEITTEKGFDIKTTLFGGSMRANLSLFDMQAKNFQVLIRNNPNDTIGLGTTQVANAEGALSRGAEFDLTWLALDWLTVIGASGFNETEYLKFTYNDCPSEIPNAQRTPQARAAGGPCDASGKRFPYAPKWNNALSIVSNIGLARLPLVGGWLGATGLDLFMSVTGEHQTWSHLDTDLSKRESKVQPEFYRLKANVGIGNPAQRWTFRVIGENLNNARTWIRAGDVFANNIAASQNEPRLIFAQFQQDF